MDVADAIADALRMIEAQAEAQKIRLSTNYDRTLPRLLADHRRVRQVLLNLLSNAVKFTPDGGAVAVEAFGGPAGVTIRVIDNGIGMAPEDIPVALERFGQIDSDLARKYEGTGLGLPLSKCLMEHHGGTLEIESAPGRGTRVSVAFPAERVILRTDRAAASF